MFIKKIPVNLPNILTFSRIASVPFLAVLLLNRDLFSNHLVQVSLTLLVYTFASLTDYYDGYIARKQKKHSGFGEFLDPIADKVLILGCYVFFIFSKEIYLPIFLVLLIIFRDVFVTLLRMVFISKKNPIKTQTHGKFKTVSQIVSQIIIFLVLFCHAIIYELKTYHQFLVENPQTLITPDILLIFNAQAKLLPQACFVVLKYLPVIFVSIACFFSLYSGYKYCTKVFKMKKK